MLYKYPQIPTNTTYQLLNRYNPTSEEESLYKQKMLELIDCCPDCFLRSCRVGHFTASAFLLNKEMTHVLLMHHTKLDKWMQLGGHCDGDSDVLNVAIKEAQEESGIINIRALKSDIFDIDIHLIPPTEKEASHYHFDIRFLLHAHLDDKFTKNHESKELKWIEKTSKNIPSESESVLRMFRKLNNINVDSLII